MAAILRAWPGPVLADDDPDRWRLSMSGLLPRVEVGEPGRRARGVANVGPELIETL